jgi:hypothetical protein
LGADFPCDGGLGLLIREPQNGPPPGLFKLMKKHCSIITLGVLLGAGSLANATIVGFGQLGGSNTTVPGALASFATADGAGFVVANGITPNIGLVWDANWDIHTSAQFTGLENQTAGGGDWDNEGGVPRVGQLDTGVHSIVFNVDDGFALALNSFDFAHTPETAGTTEWTVTLSDAFLNVVWQQVVPFTNGEAFTIAPNFVGAPGEDYTLVFSRNFTSYPAEGRHGIDNLSFNQVPEPATAGLASIAGLMLLARRRRS